MTTVLANARIVDVVAGRTYPGDVVIDGERIANVRDRSRSGTEPEARSRGEVRDLGGAYLMPGLLSIHVHPGVMADDFRQDANGLSAERMRRDLATWLRFGVTTVQSMGFDRPFAFDVAREQAAGAVRGARLLSVGHGLGVAGGVPAVPMDPPGPLRHSDPAEVRRTLETQRDHGASGMKLWYDDWYGQYPKMERDVARTIVESAAALGLRSYAHVYRVDDAKDLVLLGLRTLAHMPRDRVADRGLWDLMKERDVAVVPTLIVPDSNVVFLDDPAFLDDRLFAAAASTAGVALVRSDTYRASVRAKPEFGRLRQDLADAMANVGGAYRAGVRFGFGTDAGVTQRVVGYGEHRELELLVAAGVRAADAIRMATADSAALLGRDDLGQIAAGRRADLVVLDADPLADVRNARRIREVWQDGRVVAGAL